MGIISSIKGAGFFVLIATILSSALEMLSKQLKGKDDNDFGLDDAVGSAIVPIGEAIVDIVETKTPSKDQLVKILTGAREFSRKLDEDNEGLDDTIAQKIQDLILSLEKD